MNEDKQTNIDQIFKAYDIRGLAPTQLNEHVAYAIGKAFADFLPAGKVAVGRDMRNDSDEIANGLVAGLVEQGREVVDLGQITSDMIYFAVGMYKLAGGAMITASHNPGAYDGIKLTGEGVVPIGINTGLLTIKTEIKSGHYKSVCEKGCDNNIVIKRDIIKEWVEHALSVAGKLNKSLQVGTDTGNGMAAIVLPYLKQLTSIELTSIYTEIDGNFPNHLANPLVPENTKDLQALVVEKGLDCGIAFDGDGDRAFMIDEKGRRVSASVMGAVLVEHILIDHPGATILYNVITSNIVPDTIERLGGKAIHTRVGHSFIKADMRKHQAVFACEHSGHFYFSDNYYADSGLIAALMMLGIISKSNKTLSELAAPFTSTYVNSEELNFALINNGDKQLESLHTHFADGQVDQLDGLTIRFEDWWFNARASNTEPFLRVNIEASDQKSLDSHRHKIQELLK